MRKEIDRKRVISGLEHHMGVGCCGGCPYFDECDILEPDRAGEALLWETLALLGKVTEPPKRWQGGKEDVGEGSAGGAEGG